MGEAIQEKADRTTLYKLNNGYPEDGLPGILQTNHKTVPISYSEQPDLTLRLSLGEVCSQNLKASPLIRSASVAGVITQTTEVGVSGGLFHPGLSLSLDRTSSLRSETEQKGLTKLKEWQSIRRMEAKKRLVGQRNGRLAPEVEKSAHGFQSGCRTPVEEQERLLSSPEKKGSDTQRSPKQRKIMHGNPAETSGEARANTWAQNNPWKKTKKNSEVSDDIAGMKVMKTMPSVMATGDGPNGRNVEGFLYTYKRGEVSIVCVCHGSFLSPAEFVKHAAGVDVVNPMKHIRVRSTAASF